MPLSQPNQNQSASPDDPNLAGLMLVTGCYRSGTTLTEKLLHQHPQICLGSQPFPILYFYAKQALLDALGIQRRYPLDHLFGEDEFAQADFIEFLNHLELTRQDLDTIFDRLADYELGLWTPGVLGFRDSIQPGRFSDVYRQLHYKLATFLGRPAVPVIGSKEVLCEEYTGWLLEGGGRVVIVIRDPRDMIASLDYRERDNMTGDHRPLLYSLRAWRKSVAIVLTYRDRENFYWLRYEDLARIPGEVLTELAARFGLLPFPEGVAERPLTDQQGQPWQGNSSFRDLPEVSTQSIGGFRQLLPAEALAYIETVCRPEMRCLGYGCESAAPLDLERLHGYREPHANPHAKFPLDYSHARARVEAEQHRLSLLDPDARTLTSAEANSWFLSPMAYHALRNHAPLKQKAGE